MQLAPALMAHALTGLAATAGQPSQPACDVIVLPSRALEEARPVVTLSVAAIWAGPRLEAAMRRAVLRSTEALYDL